MAIDPRLIEALHLQSGRHAALAAGDDATPHVAFQTSTLEALLDGAYDGDLAIGELRRHGDLGLGTFDALDGEMVLIDGVVWRAKADGTIEPVDDAECTPFAVVTPFTADTVLAIDAAIDQEELLARVAALATGPAAADGALALRFDGTLDHVHARSVPPQPKPYPPLVEAAATQQQFTIGPVEGSLVGFVFPSWVGGVELPGVHLHAITADRTRGGHVLHARVGPGILSIDPLTDLHLELPAGVELPEHGDDPDRASALDRLEND
jgi:acetolactate decarboxylase